MDSNKIGSYEEKKLIEKPWIINAGNKIGTVNNIIIKNPTNKYKFILTFSTMIANFFPKKNNQNIVPSSEIKDVSGNSFSQQLNNTYKLRLNDNTRKYSKKNWKVNFFIIIILLIFFRNSKENKQRMICPYSSNITIKIEGPGESKIFYGGKSCSKGTIFKNPDEVYINEKKQIYVNNSYYFEKPENTVKLVWYNTMNNGNCLFKDCININLFLI